MLPYYFIYVAVLVRLLGGVGYVRATIDGRAKPNPLSWLFWGMTPFIAFFAEVNAGVGLPALVTLALGVSPMTVFIVAMHKNPKSFRLDGFNLLCAALAILGIILWQTTRDPHAAILLAIFADTASAIPTLRKIWRIPNSEYIPTYMLSVLSMVITLLAIKNWNFATYAFPVYILSINLFIIWFILHSRWLKRRLTKKRPPAKRRRSTTTRRPKARRPRRATAPA